MAKKKSRYIVYLSAECKPEDVSRKEDKQLRYINDYARARGIHIVEVVRRNGMSGFEMNKQFARMTALIERKKADGILITKAAVIAGTIEQAYMRAGQVAAVGGRLVTVDEGELSFNLHINRRSGL